MKTTIQKANEVVAGWVMCVGGGKFRWMPGCSKAGAFYSAKRASAEWCRPYVIRDGERVVCC